MAVQTVDSDRFQQVAEAGEDQARVPEFGVFQRPLRLVLWRERGSRMAEVRCIGCGARFQATVGVAARVTPLLQEGHTCPSDAQLAG